MKVLVVDDNDDIRLLVQTVLSLHGFDVVEACDGSEALAIARGDDPPAVALVDISIPPPDGLEVLAAIRADQLPIKVVIFSAHTDVATERRAIEAGADGFVVKPFTPTALGDTITRLTAGS